MIHPSNSAICDVTCGSCVHNPHVFVHQCFHGWVYYGFITDDQTDDTSLGFVIIISFGCIYFAYMFIIAANDLFVIFFLFQFLEWLLTSSMTGTYWYTLVMSTVCILPVKTSRMLSWSSLIMSWSQDTHIALHDLLQQGWFLLCCHRLQQLQQNFCLLACLCNSLQTLVSWS